MYKKVYRLLAAAFVVLGICLYWNNQQTDWYNQSFTPEYVGETYVGSDSFHARFALGNMEKGRYSFYISYGELSAADDLDISLRTPYSPGEDNTPALTFPAENLSVQDSVLYFEVALPDQTRGVELVFTSHTELLAALLDVQGQGRIYNDSLFFLALCLLLALGCLFYGEKRADQANKVAQQAFWVCFAIGVFASLPLLGETVGYGHDLHFHTERIQSIYEGLAGGQFPVRISGHFTHGAGQAMSTMYPELFLYIPALLRFAGVSVVTGYQFLGLLANLACAFFTYICVYRMCGRRGMGLLASFSFTLGMYHIVSLYTRAAMAEVLAMAFMPCLVLGLYEVFYREEKRYGWLVLGATGVLSSHMLTVQMCAVFCLVFAVVSIRRLRDAKRLLALCKAGTLTVLLNLYFLVPMLSLSTSGIQMRILTMNNKPEEMSTGLVHIFNIFSPVADTRLGAGFVLGAGIVLFLGGLLYSKPANGEDRRLAGIGTACLCFAGLAIFLGSSLFPWSLLRRIPVIGTVFSTVQFAWRYFGIACVLLSIVFAIAVYRLCTHRAWLAVLAGGLACGFAIMPYFASYTSIETVTYSKFEDTFLTTYTDYLDENTLVHEWLQPDMTIHFPLPGASVSGYQKQDTNLRFSYTADEALPYADLPLYYYPGYAAQDSEGNALAVTAGENYRLRVELGNTQSGSITVRYKGFWYFRAAEILSLATLLTLCAYPLLKKRKIIPPKIAK